MKRRSLTAGLGAETPSVEATLDLPMLNLGQTIPRINGTAVEPHAFDDADASVFNLRVGPDYKRNRRKQVKLAHGLRARIVVG